MAWQRLHDDNPENRVAGNADDFVKHAAYIALLETLARQLPWRAGMHVHECHAGRGVYAIAHDDPRRALIDASRGTSLGELQRAALERVSADPQQHHPGSALLVHTWLARQGSAHTYEGFEWDPNTRRILRALLGPACVPGSHGEERFDGETFIADTVSDWSQRDVVLMDPFAVWDRDQHRERRDRYDRIFEALASHPDAPTWSLYLTWRANADAVASEAELARRFAPRRRVRLSWCFGVPCTMWLGVPASRLEELSSALVARFEGGELGECLRAHHVRLEGAERPLGGGEELVRVDIV